MRYAAILMIILLSAGCGPDKKSDVSSNNDSAQVQGQGTGKAVSSNGAEPVKPVPQRTLEASGQTEDGKPVTLTMTATGTVLGGTLRVGDIDSKISGMLDGTIVRAWLIAGSDASSLWQGNLIGQESEGAVSGTFVMSDSAGQQVMKGRIASN